MMELDVSRRCHGGGERGPTEVVLRGFENERLRLGLAGLVWSGQVFVLASFLKIFGGGTE
jgi:hypothetical protein